MHLVSGDSSSLCFNVRQLDDQWVYNQFEYLNIVLYILIMYKAFLFGHLEVWVL